MIGNSGTGRARLLIYAAVPDQRMLRQGFYAAEAAGLSAHPAIADVRLSNSLSRVWRDDYDGLVSFFYSHSAAAAALARTRGKPVVATGGAEQLFAHMATGLPRYAARIAAFQATASFATHILATSSSDLARMRRIAGFARDKFTLSFHGAAAVQCRAGIPAFFERPAGSLITICGLDTSLNLRRKGIPEAIALLARIVREEPAARLTIVGRSTCRAEVEDCARALDVSDRVDFTGYVSEHEKIALLRAHRYYVQLSVYEGFGVGALEALSQGCLVIHSGAGGLADTVGEFGVRVDREAISEFRLDALPDPVRIDDPRLARHLERFRASTRADAIVAALFGGDRGSAPADADAERVATSP